MDSDWNLRVGGIMHKKLLVYLLIALCMLIVFAILRSNVVGRIQLKNLEGCARDCGVLKPQVEFNAGLNSEEGRRIRQKYDSAWNVFVAPTSESKFLGRRLTPVRDYFPTEKISSKDVAAIDRWIEIIEHLLSPMGILRHSARLQW